MALEIISLSVCVVLMIVFIAVRVVKGGVAGLLTKILASVAFVCAGILAVVTNGGGLGLGLIAMGLVMGLIGDIVLDLKVIYPESDYPYTNAGILSFGIGHILYAAGLSLLANPSSNLLNCILISLAIAIVLSILIMLSSKVLKLNFGKYFWQSFSYAVALVFMAAYSIALSLDLTIMYIAAVGFILFLLSDLILSMQYFGDKLHNKALITINHTLYYLAQISIVAFMFFV